MKITIVTDAWHPQVNGVVTTLTNTIRCLESQGHIVEVIEPSQFKGPLLPWLHGLKLSLPPYKMARRIRDADAVHIVSEGPLGLAAKLYCDWTKRPYTTAFHTNYAVYLQDHFGLPQAVGFALLRWFHRRSTAMMVPSQSMIATLAQNGFKNAVHWRRGVDASIFTPEGQGRGWRSQGVWGPGPYWLNVGRVSKEKNLEAFLDLDLPGVKVIVGDGPDREELELKYQDVWFIGEVRGPALADFYRAADVFVFPSRFDTYGLVIAEAISCGTPVAAYPVTGPIDIIADGVTGALDDDLKTACLRALDLPRPHQSFSWDDATKDFAAHLKFVTKDS